MRNLQPQTLSTAAPLLISEPNKKGHAKAQPLLPVLNRLYSREGDHRRPNEYVGW